MNDKTITYICIFIAVVIILMIGFNFKVSEESNIAPVSYTDNDFVKNEVLIGLSEEYTSSILERFLSNESDIKDFETLDNKTYVVTLNYDFKSREELNNYCDYLTKNKFIQYCEANNIIKLDDCTKGPC